MAFLEALGLFVVAAFVATALIFMTVVLYDVYEEWKR